MRSPITDHLPAMFQEAGIEQISITPHHEVSDRTMPNFQTRIGIWADTASSRGVQMERDGYITENDYLTAEKEYREWIIQDANSLTMYMLAVEGVRVV